MQSAISTLLGKVYRTNSVSLRNNLQEKNRENLYIKRFKRNII